MSDSTVTGASSTSNSRIDDSEKDHRTEIDLVRDQLSRLHGVVYTTKEEVRAGLRRFQSETRGLESSIGLDDKTKAALDREVAKQGEIGPVGLAHHAISSGISHAVHATHRAETFLSEVTHEHVGRLRPGDSVELTGSIKIAAEGVDSEEKGKLTVSRDAAGKFTIEASDDYGLKGAGVVAAGGSVGLKLVADTPEDAERLTALLARGALAAHSAGAGILASSGHDTEADLAFVREHLTAVSLGAEASAKLKGILGDRESGLGAFASAAISGTIGEKVTLEMDRGHITGLQCDASCKVKGAARAGTDVQPSGVVQGGKPAKLSAGHRDLGIDFDGTETSTVTVRTHMDIPRARTPEQQRMGADALIASLQSDIMKSARVDVALSVEGVVSGNGSFVQSGGSGKLSVTFQGVKADGKGALVDALARGDVDAAFAAAKVSAQTCAVKAELYVEHGDIHSASLGNDKTIEASLDLQVKDRHQVQVYAPIIGSPADVLRSLGAGSHTQTAPAVASYPIYC